MKWFNGQKPQEASYEKGTPTFTRRELLAFGALGGASIIALSFPLRTFIDKLDVQTLTNDIFSSNEQFDNTVATLLPVLLDAARANFAMNGRILNENPNYLPPIEILKRGIQAYGGKVYWQATNRPTDATTNPIFQSLNGVTLKTVMQATNFDKNDQNSLKASRRIGDVKGQIMARLDGISSGNVSLFAKNIGHSTDISSVRGSGFEGKSAEEISRELGQAIYSNDRTAPQLLAHYLDTNNGNLNLALTDTAITLKLMARNKLDPNFEYVGGNSEYHSVLVGRFTGKSGEFPDNFNVLGDGKYNYTYTTLKENVIILDNSNKDFSPVNLIGSPYHVFSTIALLSSLPPSAIARSVFLTQLYEIKGQGYIKTATDFFAIRQIHDIDHYLLSFQR